LDALGRGFDSRVGIAVESVEGGWTASWDGRSLYPQQSVAKLCTAITLLDDVDRGWLSLSEQVVVLPQDLSVFHQPIQARVSPEGYLTTLGALLVDAIAESDNAADDILIRRVGGSEAVQQAIASKGIGGVRCGPQVHILESNIAGLRWRPEYSFGQAFWEARARVDPSVRRAKLQAYLANPEDGASPLALADLLARLERGELLSPGSTRRLLDIMARTRTGPLRLPAGLGRGWRIAHKTGTGQDLGSLSTGNNDVGILTAPDGRVYTVAVMIASTRRPVPDRQRLMAAVARAVVAVHDGAGYPAPYDPEPRPR
jgi:beta-lactamase class A